MDKKVQESCWKSSPLGWWMTSYVRFFRLSTIRPWLPVLYPTCWHRRLHSSSICANTSCVWPRARLIPLIEWKPNPVVVGSQPCIVVSTAAVAKELFQLNDAVFSSRPRRLFLTVFLGTAEYKNLVGAPYGPHWRQLRKLCNMELFSPRRQASYQKMRTEEIHNMMRILLENSQSGKASNLKLWLYGATVNIMTRMLVNKR